MKKDLTTTFLLWDTPCTDLHAKQVHGTGLPHAAELDEKFGSCLRTAEKTSGRAKGGRWRSLASSRMSFHVHRLSTESAS